MTVSARSLAAGVAAAVLFSPAGRADDAPYHNAEYKFKLTVPAGWRTMRADEVDRANAIGGHTATGGGVRFVAGFRPTDGAAGRAPWALVQLDPSTAGMSFEEFKTRYHAGYANCLPTPGAPVGPPSFDPNRQWFVFGSGAGDCVRPLAVRSLGKLGPDGALVIHCYAPAATFETHQPTFTTLKSDFWLDGEERVWQTGQQFAPKGPLQLVLDAADVPLKDRGALMSGVAVVAVLLFGGWWVSSRG